MRWKRHIRIDREGLKLDADVNVVIATNEQQVGGVSRATAVSGVQAIEPDASDAPDPPQEQASEERSSDDQ